MRLHSTIALTLVFSLFAATACATPQTKPADERAQIEQLLRGIHGLPEQSRFEAVSADPAKILRVIAVDREAGPMRTAALEALKWYPDDKTMAIYGEALTPDNAPGVRYKTVRYLAVFGEAAVPAAAELSRDDDPMMRRMAGALLFELPGEAASKALDAAIRAETDDTVRAELQGLVDKKATIR